MSAHEHPMRALQAYLPAGTFEKDTGYIHEYKVHLTITRERKSILGDYRNAIRGKNHRISVNGNLNRYAFLITLLHEIAHLLAFEKFGQTIAAHGKEWKSIYKKMLADFMRAQIFPSDISAALHASLENPAASSCAEEELMRVLKKYDKQKSNFYFIEDLMPGNLFKTPEGKVFERGGKLRKRYRCKEINTGLEYLFSPVYEVEKV